jgi:hypothetical protein
MDSFQVDLLVGEEQLHKGIYERNCGAETTCLRGIRLVFRAILLRPCLSKAYTAIIISPQKELVDLNTQLRREIMKLMGLSIPMMRPT